MEKVPCAYAYGPRYFHSYLETRELKFDVKKLIKEGQASDHCLAEDFSLEIAFIQMEAFLAQPTV